MMETDKKLSDFTKVLELMREGWELGYATRIRRLGRYWLQKKLCCGGETFDVHSSTARSMLKKNLIIEIPRRETDSYWLTRYKTT